MSRKKLILFLLWTVVMDARADYQYDANYAGNKYQAFNPAAWPGVQAPTRPVDPVIFERCWVESQLPMVVALGDLTQYAYMCSPNYFSTCRTGLPVALLSYGISPYQRDYIMSVFYAWVEGGAPYLCNIGLTALNNLMLNGGSACLQKTAGTRVQKCNRQLATLGTGLEYSDQYCYDWDDDFQCYIDAVNTCPNEQLENFLWDFFENVMWASPCKDISRFTNHAHRSITIHSILLILFLVAPFIILKH